MPRKIKKRSTFKRRGQQSNQPDWFRRKTIKAQNTKQATLKGYV